MTIYKNTGGVRVRECSWAATCLSEHSNDICEISINVCVSVRVCLFACASTYPFVHVCVIWCVWCVVVKHICLQAISFAYFSQPVHWVSGSLMHTVFNWQLWYSWSPTVMVRYSLGVAALPDRHHTHLENESSKRVMVCVCVCECTCTNTFRTSQSQLH